MNDSANILYFHNHRNTDKENNRFDSKMFDLLDNNNISWSLQNTVSALGWITMKTKENIYQLI